MVSQTIEKRIDIITTIRSNASKMRKNLREFNATLGQNIEGFKKQNKANVSAINAGGKFAGKLRMMTHGMRGFRMEMLGVMFFGMALQRFFTGLLKPALQMAGIFDLINTVLGIVFLPIVLALLDPILALANFLMNMSEGAKLALGKIVIFGAILGSVLFLIGTFALGIGSIILAFGGLFTFISNLLGPIGRFGAGLFLIGGASKVIGPIWNSMKSIMSKVFDKFLEIPFIQDLLAALGIDIEDLKKPWKTIKTKAKSFFDWLKEKTGVDVAEDITNLKDTFEDFAESLGTIANALTETIVPALKKFFEITEKIAKSSFAKKLFKFAISDPLQGIDEAITRGQVAGAQGVFSGPALNTFITELNITPGVSPDFGPLGPTVEDRVKAYLDTEFPRRIREITGGTT